MKLKFSSKEIVNIEISKLKFLTTIAGMRFQINLPLSLSQLEQKISLKNKKIGIHQIAAIMEFIGLKSVLLSPKEKELINRFPCPCLMFMKNRPVV